MEFHSVNLELSRKRGLTVRSVARFRNQHGSAVRPLRYLVNVQSFMDSEKVPTLFQLCTDLGTITNETEGVSFKQLGPPERQIL